MYVQNYENSLSYATIIVYILFTETKQGYSQMYHYNIQMELRY